MSDFIVEITRRPPGDARLQAGTLADIFNLSPAKAEQLLKRLPGVVTRPVPEPLASAIAQRFTQAGIDARIRPSNPAASESPFPALAEPPAQPVPTPSSGVAYPSFEDAPARPTMGGVQSYDPDAGFPTAGAPQADVPSQSGARHPTLGEASAESLRDEAPATVSSAQTRGRRGGIRSKLLAIAILPTLLAILGALVVTWFVVRPALYEQLLDSARNPAIATAASLSGNLRGGDGTGLESLRLLETIQIARQTFPRGSISFIVATDPEGSPISGWFEEEQGFDPGSRALEEAIRQQAVAAATRGTEASRAERTGSYRLASGESIEIVAQPLLGQNDEALGTVVVGVTDQAVTQQVIRILLSILLFSLIPLALAILFAVARARSITRPILALTHRADEISRGNLEASVDDIKSNDELEDLGAALERLRASMQEAMTRLRRRRG